MRDPNRIDGVLAVVAEAWKAHPDLRLSQLIMNYAIYQTEDDVLVSELYDHYLPPPRPAGVVS